MEYVAVFVQIISMPQPNPTQNLQTHRYIQIFQQEILAETLWPVVVRLRNSPNSSRLLFCQNSGQDLNIDYRNRGHPFY
jgi:hypothetical protein